MTDRRPYLPTLRGGSPISVALSHPLAKPVGLTVAASLVVWVILGKTFILLTGGVLFGWWLRGKVGGR